jgi:putative holliday junction resolvase
MKKISALGLDIGNKRIGVAGCDKLGLFATALTTVNRASFQEDVTIFQEIVKEREATLLVVGLPYFMDGTLGKQAQKVQKYAQRLAKALDLPLEYMDEKLTSVAAQEQLKSQKRFNSRDKGIIDQVAAQIILQNWLDS